MKLGFSFHGQHRYQGSLSIWDIGCSFRMWVSWFLIQIWKCMLRDLSSAVWLSYRDTLPVMTVSPSLCSFPSGTQQTCCRSVTWSWPPAQWVSWLRPAAPPTCQGAGSGMTRMERPLLASLDPGSRCPATGTAPPITAGWRRRAPTRGLVGHYSKICCM